MVKVNLVFQGICEEGAFQAEPEQPQAHAPEQINPVIVPGVAEASLLDFLFLVAVDALKYLA